jgi:hypothetical protein
MNNTELLEKLKLTEDELKHIKDDLIETKERLKKYTAPARSKTYYDNHKEDIIKNGVLNLQGCKSSFAITSANIIIPKTINPWGVRSTNDTPKSNKIIIGTTIFIVLPPPLLPSTDAVNAIFIVISNKMQAISIQNRN